MLSMVRCRVRVSTKHQVKWAMAEHFPRQLVGVRDRVAFEVSGNADGVEISLVSAADDLAIVNTAFEATFTDARLEVLDGSMTHPIRQAGEADWSDAAVADLVAPTLYSRLHTRPDELAGTPLAAVLHAVTQVPRTATAIWQVVFQPVRHAWHRNIRTMHNAEFLAVNLEAAGGGLRGLQQLPSGDSRQLALAMADKAHNDKPLFAVALRLAVVGARAAGQRHLDTLCVFSGLLQQGGYPLQRQGTEAWSHLSPALLHEVFAYGRVHRHGFLLNSAELTPMMHIPLTATLEAMRPRYSFLEHLVPETPLDHGCHIGNYRDIAETRRLCIPDSERSKTIHIVGKKGQGKSCLMQTMMLQDIRRGQGLMLLDPHNDLAQDMLDHIAPEDADRLVYLDWSDSSWAPSFNPLANAAPEHRGRVADDFIYALKTFVEGWGDRLEKIVRFGVYGLLHLPNTSLLDLAESFMPGSRSFEHLRREVLGVAEDPLLRVFWKEELSKYKRDELSPPLNKLVKLVGTPPISYTFSHPSSKLNLHRVIDENQILLVNLSGMGAEARKITGALLLGLVMVEMLKRSGTAKHRRHLFHVYADEASYFVTDAIEHLCAEARKYRVGLVLAHQYLQQFTKPQTHALLTAGARIVFNVDDADARLLCADTQKRVTEQDITGLRDREAIVKIKHEVCRVRTPDLPARRGPGCRDRIIQQSRARYYNRLDQVREDIRKRHHRWSRVDEPLMSDPNPYQHRDFTYDQW